MSFDEVQFPNKVAYGATGGPMFNTTITTLFGGYEQRNQNWSTSRGRWDISTGIKNSTDYAEVLAFFRARRGRARGFRFKDWGDYVGTSQLIGTGDASTTQFQLKKLYTSGGVTYSRDITKPVDGTVSVFVDSVAQDEGSANDYTLDTTTGIITFNSGSIPGDGLSVTATFQFDVPARFDVDHLATSIQNYEQYITQGIPVLEIRV